MKIRKKVFQDKSVLEASLERIRYVYRTFDRVVVSFSGGKDSTAVLELTVEVARQLGKLPVTTLFWDEEAIHPPTIEYVERVRQRPEIDLQWFCLPVKHRNACSNEEPYWYCWDERCKEKWVRPMPENGITQHPRFTYGMSFQEFSDVMFTREGGSVAMLDGVRTQESFRRMKAVSTKQADNYISGTVGNGPVSKVHPIYDWSSEDVWRLVRARGIDYNRTYDVFDKTRLHSRYLAQRVCPPFGEEPLRGLWIYAEAFPEMWHRMLHRVPGVATAWRYANTELYGVNGLTKEDGETWEEVAWRSVESYAPEDRETVKANVESLVGRHEQKTPDAVPDADPHPLTGTSWKLIAQVAIKGDLKGRTAPKLEGAAIAVRKKLGIASYEEAKKIYGHKKSMDTRNQAALPEGCSVQPINQVVWRHRDTLKPNGYNPNKVAPPEMKLLVISIQEAGWTTAIVVNPDLEIVDGFHRWTVSGYPELYAMTGGYVPTVMTSPRDRATQRLDTIRHNRARGTHGVLPMADLVESMLRDGLTVAEVCERCQMEREEVFRLSNRKGIPRSKLLDGDFSRSWKPE